MISSRSIARTQWTKHYSTILIANFFFLFTNKRSSTNYATHSKKGRVDDTNVTRGSGLKFVLISQSFVLSQTIFFYKIVFFFNWLNFQSTFWNFFIFLKCFVTPLVEVTTWISIYFFFITFSFDLMSKNILF